jgi:hypothetical protein
VSPNENNRRIDAFRKLLSTAPTPGTNTILITHKPNIVDALGKDWFDVKEGEASIFRPENGSYKLIARVQMEEWPHLAAASASRPKDADELKMRAGQNPGLPRPGFAQCLPAWVTHASKSGLRVCNSAL